MAKLTLDEITLDEKTITITPTKADPFSVTFRRPDPFAEWDIRQHANAGLDGFHAATAKLMEKQIVQWDLDQTPTVENLRRLLATEPRAFFEIFNAMSGTDAAGKDSSPDTESD